MYLKAVLFLLMLLLSAIGLAIEDRVPWRIALILLLIWSSARGLCRMEHKGCYVMSWIMSWHTTVFALFTQVCSSTDDIIAGDAETVIRPGCPSSSIGATVPTLQAN
jgi:hypothetical protein